MHADPGHRKSEVTFVILYELLHYFLQPRVSQVVTSHCLGSGSYATVNLAIDTNKYRQVACKTIRTKTEDDMKKVQKEVQILMKLHHVY